MDRKRFDKHIINYNQSIKDCKKSTPDNSITSGYLINVSGNSLITNKKIEGDYIFDSYDKYDNTIFVIKNGICINIPWNNVNYIVADQKGKKFDQEYNIKHNYIK